ncbi:ABC transporter ATP-binding protein [Microvirga puerhi]|uniref:ATP-binding cassette domain-containing protein n=1 Tax=Microvirga puerhi TaxID=2876078 RepID=A0ABS7VL83_9HYPH|nr:ATP-binding cassette domain-containing protein [Microvirga puerhi]MBZ6076293.1 ATP-binding cassette domain-containing protein [Microvirga puerhi]
MASVVLENVYVDFPLLQQDQRSLKRLLSAPRATSRFKMDDSSRVIVRGLREVNLSLQDGDRVGVIGLNGAGKSTLLRVMAGIYPPTTGSVAIKGKVGALLTVGLGLRDDVSGFKNIEFCLMLFGIPPEEIPERRAEIVDFTNLGDFIHLHVGAYSAGMRTRLAFAIATSIDPEILVLDEVFGAGDSTFLKKAQERMHDLIHKARIFVFASHAPGLLEQFCDKALFLDGGAIQAFGPLGEVMELYEQTVAARS